MNTRANRFFLSSWPIWVKLLVGFSVALALLSLPAFVWMRSGVEDVAVQNARTFLSGIGTEQKQAIESALTNARSEMRAFLNNPENERILVGLLLGTRNTGVSLNLPQVDAADMVPLFRQTLLNLTTSPFESIRVLDRSGQVLAQVSANSTAISSADESNSPAYRAATAALLQGQTQSLAVSSRGVGVIEMTLVVQWRDGTPIGFLVARLSNARIVFNNVRIPANDNPFGAFSFLTTAVTTTTSVLIAPNADLQRANETDESVAVDRGLAGQTGTELYLLREGDQTEYIGYYAPILGTPFTLIVQTPSENAYSYTLGYFSVRGFVVAVGVVTLIAVLVLLFNGMIVPPINRLRRATQALRDGDFDLPVTDTARGDEIGALATSFVTMRDQVRGLIADLEQRVESRSRDIAATQEISRFAATQRDLQLLLDRVVSLIIESFPNIYHAQIFLNDGENQWAVLRASTGEPGRQLLSRGHRLAVGSVSVIGQVTQQGRLVVARDTAVSQVHRRNEFLPDTRAELAIPLRVGDQIIGALDVQSKQRDAFAEDQVSVLTTMADQIAVAIQNARLYEDSIRRVAEIEDINRQATLRAWQDYMRDQRATALVQEAGTGTSLDMSPLRQQALLTGEVAMGRVTERSTVPIAVPIKLRGQTLGSVEWEIPVTNFGEDRLELAKALADRLALSLDNARLFQESTRATERERLVNNIAAKLTAQNNINDILQTAVREVGQALRAPQVSINLRRSANGSHENGNGS
ncbi:MAG: GAF domain-containing protein [Anaerolinea sp.]|nr:GAF domain-containing protein [Anaerolinea sp.]